MATTLTHSTEIPSSGENGQQFCPELERNWTRYDEHDHSGGSKGAAVPSTSITKQTGTAPSGSWALVANDIYKQTVTLPTGYAYDTTTIFAFIDNAPVALRIEKASSNTFEVYINDNSKAVSFLYI